MILGIFLFGVLCGVGIGAAVMGWILIKDLTNDMGD